MTTTKQARVVAVGVDLPGKELVKLYLTPKMEQAQAENYRDWIASGVALKWAVEKEVYKHRDVVQVAFVVELSN